MAMRVALAVWDGRISPVFDVSREAVILTVEHGAVTDRRSESVETPTVARKVDRLLALGVEQLVCGAISESLHREVTARGVRVLGFVAGDLEEVVRALVAGRLPSPAFSMPGCCGKQNRYRGGCGVPCGDGRGRGRRGRW
ncbi:MAG TPA: NifB/NifX family molybdenum-iron cluster-binding protein [Anaeromyxobacteraceae bacterium]|nr:NifB/NifX family molybdenum-iron cluster-binding protein [Anaeromyxobacteraceae bacterium]